MRKLIVFNQISLDGYIADARGDMSWAHNSTPDPEWSAFVSENAKGGGELVFGRVTYELLASYWPTPQASKANPVVAERMNGLPKVVFSSTLGEATWKNTRVLKGDVVAEARKLKDEAGLDLVVMGSGKLVSALTAAGLVDEYQVALNPVILGGGKTMFEGVREKVRLTLSKTRAFKNGNVVLWYQPTR
jgi:dihydrofolate reductase